MRRKTDAMRFAPNGRAARHARDVEEPSAAKWVGYNRQIGLDLEAWDK